MASLARQAMTWLCLQIGRREYYAIPRGLRCNGQQVRLITDFCAPKLVARKWLKPFLPAFVRDRQIEGDAGRVETFNLSGLRHELGSRLRGGTVFERALRRNQWFEQSVSRRLRGGKVVPDVVFSYSYAAQAAITFARERKIPLILGQIDGGLNEERYLHEVAGRPLQAPPWYWEQWKMEVAAADAVVVNSPWSWECLERSGCAPKRVEVIPLAYEAGSKPEIERPSPERYVSERPLRVLFLGQIVARKGMAALLGAIAKAEGDNLPIEFHFVGDGESGFITSLQGHPKVRYHGRASAAEVGKFYQEADIFILPTLSDGFAITQLEAQSYGLPVIASRHCGQVVVDGQNGLLLEEITDEAIHEVLSRLCWHPEEVARMQKNSRVGPEYSLQNIGRRYVELAECLR